MKELVVIFDRWILFILAVVGAVLSIIALNELVALEYVLKESSLSENMLPDNPAAISCELCSSEYHQQRAALLYKDALTETDINAARDKICQAIDSAERAVHVDPLSAGVLITYVNYLQKVGESCNQTQYAAQKGQIDLIKRAVAAAPRNPEVLFNAALLYTTLGERPSALPLLQRFLLYQADVSYKQKVFISEQFHQEQNLTDIIPSRLTQVLEWSEFMAGFQPELFYRWSKTFEELQIKALSEFVKINGLSVPRRELYIKQLKHLMRFAASSTVRSNLDSILAELFEETDKLTARYYQLRSAMESLVVVPGMAVSDSRPEKRALSYWGVSKPGRLHSRSNSIGFFLPAPQNVRLIELRLDSAELAAGAVQLLTSPNNRDWHLLDLKAQLAPVSEGDVKILNFHLEDRNDRYWKLFFRAPGNDRLVVQDVRTFMQVYGRSYLLDQEDEK